MKIKMLLAAVLLLLSSAVWAAQVNLNTADAKALAALDGIGPVKAEAIVAYREKNGPFQSVEDVVLVKGIGEKTVAANRDRITVEQQ